MWSMKRRWAAAVTAVGVFVASTGAAAASVPIDVQRHWAGNAVNTLMENGVISGRANGRFQPDQPISREELSSILYNLILVRGLEVEETRPGWIMAKEEDDEADAAISESDADNDIDIADTEGEADAKGLAEEDIEDGDDAEGETEDKIVGEEGKDEDSRMKPEKVSFSDVEDSRWSSDAVSYLAGYGIISGYPNGTFRPTETLTRKDLAVIVDRYRDYVAAENGGNNRSLLTLTGNADGGAISSFTDIGNSYARDAIERLVAEGIVTGYSDGSFRPDATVTRGEAAAIVYSIAGLGTTPVVVELPAKNVIEVPYISQVYPVNAPVGCEATALLMGLKGKGYAQDVSLREFLDAMPKHSSNPAKGFVGSPYVADKAKKTRTTIYPPKLAEFASAYGNVSDFSGASLSELQAELLAGNPVVVYVTLWWEKPFYRYYSIEGESQYLLSNNHAVLVDGYDSETNAYHIADPYNLRNTSQEYRYWMDGATFEPLYEERRHALVVE